MSGTMALAQAIGADLARPRPARRMGAYTTFLSIKWLLLGALFGLPIVFNAAGIAMSDATTAFWVRPSALLSHFHRDGAGNGVAEV